MNAMEREVKKKGELCQSKDKYVKSFCGGLELILLIKT